MPHPSHGNISKRPVVPSTNKTRDPLASRHVSCFLKLLRTSRNISTDYLFRYANGHAWLTNIIFVKKARKGERDLMHWDTAVSCTCSKSCWATCRSVHVFMLVHTHKHYCGGVRKASVSSLLPSLCVNLKDCGACLWMRACVYFTSLCFVWYFNPLGHISELKNFGADIAF